MSALLDSRGQAIRHCASPGCPARAIVFPELVIPPQGHPHSRGLKINIGLGLCRKHGAEEVPANFLTDELKAMASAMVRASPVPLDFERARINLKPIGGKEWEEAADIAREGQAGRLRGLNS